MPSQSERKASKRRSRLGLVNGDLPYSSRSRMSSLGSQVPIPAHQREAVPNLSQLVTNGDEFVKTAQTRRCLPIKSHKTTNAAG